MIRSQSEIFCALAMNRNCYRRGYLLGAASVILFGFTLFHLRFIEEQNHHDVDTIHIDMANVFQYVPAVDQGENPTVNSHFPFKRYPTNVFIYPRSNKVIKGELRHIIHDGIAESKYLNATDDPMESVWVVDLLRIGDGLLYCDSLLDSLWELRGNRMDGLQLILLDYSDIGDWSRDHYEYTYSTFDSYSTNCTKLLAAMVGADNVTLSRRTHAYNRTYTCFFRDPECHGCQYLSNEDLHNCYSDDAPFQERLGDVFEFRKRNISQYVSGKSVKKAFYPVRSDLLGKINDAMSNRSLHDPIDLVRNIDVIHFWNVDETDPFANLRSRVSEALLSLRSLANIHAVARKHGYSKNQGRNYVADEYVTALLSSKMVVVCQRDEWEGHYRLMEALISGAMVLTDPMVYLPSGFKNGKNIIVYHSINDLKEKVIYFASNENLRITIARKGRELALSRHRSFHYMEDYVFNYGMALSSPFLDDFGELALKVVY